MQEIYYLNQNEVFIIGGEWYGRIILKSNDGGYTWEELLNNKNNSANKMYIIDNETMVVACNSNSIIKTNNGGLTWYETIVNLLGQKRENLPDDILNYILQFLTVQKGKKKKNKKSNKKEGGKKTRRKKGTKRKRRRKRKSKRKY